MAKKKKKQPPRRPATLSGALAVSGGRRHERLDFLFGVVLFIVALFVAIAMVSFFYTGAVDQSTLTAYRPGEWLNSNHEYANYCGSIGAIVAWALLAQNFGLAAFLIPLFLIILSLHLMGAYHINLLKVFVALAVLMLWCSVLFAFALSPYLPSLLFNPGGAHGVWVVAMVENIIGPPGLVALLVLIAVIFLTALTSQTIVWVRRLLRLGIPKGISVPWSVRTGTEDEHTGEGVETSPETTKDDEETSPDAGAPQGDGNPEVVVTDGLDPIPEGDDTTPAEGPEIIVQVPEDEEKAKGKTVGEEVDLSIPINPREPYTSYKFPSLSLLTDSEGDKPQVDMDEVKSNNARIIEVLGSFGVKIKEIKATVGPTITLYEVTPAEGIKISRIRSLEDDIALNLSALGVRIIAPIPGKGTVGIEVPNKNPRTVTMRSLLNSKRYQEATMDLPLAIGKTITNEVFMVDLAKIPHLLVAGATGQGKSVGLSVMITSLLYRKHPNEVKLVLVDPKKVEFSPYLPIAGKYMAALEENISDPIITDVTKVVSTLNSLCALMDTRYDLLKIAGAKNIKEYNAKYVAHKLNPDFGHAYMPYIVVIIDEFGDLIMTAGKEIELPIARIAQLARAVGIHMIIATQRPTTNIITGNIKANFPGRMAFRVGAMIDSRTILDRPGANQLVGRGDMLFLNGGEPVRVQCAYVDTTEVERVNEHIARQVGPHVPLLLPDVSNGDDNGGEGGAIGEIDPYFEEAARAIVLTQQGSTSMIQRKFSIGYNRAGRLMDQLEQAGVVGPAIGGKPRDVLITDEAALQRLLAKL